MNWEDDCYLLSKSKFRENANIINIFSQKNGRKTGIVYGGNSRKIRNYLQISNKLFVIYNSKNENKIGYFKTELIKAVSPTYFDDKKRTSALISLCSLLNSLLPESEPYKNIFNSFENFINSINLDNWMLLYILFEINLIKELGYDTNLNIYRQNSNLDDEITTVLIDGYNYQVPSFLISQIIPKNISNIMVKKSLIFTRNVFLNKFFKPNNLLFPNSRVILENYFN